ncbi:MAG TPA: hypothetical protein VFC99_11030, partial [Acidimicrobiia bacterium]|nr:hypothetical protein [Acidimicrobiia bacterium]
LAVGLLFGLAATMRTEALVYALVTTLVVGVLLLRHRRRLGAIVRFGGLVAAGLLLMLVANQVVERLTVGGSIRSGRAANTAAAVGADVVLRVKEALTTTIGFNHWADGTDWFLGGLAVALLGYGAWRLLGRDRNGRFLGLAAVAGAGLVYVTRFDARLGFIPGLLTASPLAVVGLFLAWRDRSFSRYRAVALLALPIVFLFQYQGGAHAQWGGRYVLTSGTLLVVAGALVVARSIGWGRIVVVGVAVAVTACGVVWLSQRTHAMADGFRTIVARHDQIVISEAAFLLREGGAFYDVDSHWLSGMTKADTRRAIGVARKSGATEFALLVPEGESRPREIDGFVRRGSQRIDFPGLETLAVTYVRAGA